MAKALRERVGKQYTGTQRTRKAVHGECTVELAKWTFPIISLCREPSEAKVSRTGLTGGMGRRTVRQRALCLPSDDGTDRPGYPSARYSLYIRAKYRYARIDVQDAAYGFRLIAARPTDAGNQHVRINCHVLPEFTFIASQGRGGSILNAVPIDDGNAMRFAIQYNQDRPFTADERQSIMARNMLMDPVDPTRRLKRLDND